MTMTTALTIPERAAAAKSDEFQIGKGFQCLSERALSGIQSKRREFVRMKHSDISGVITKRNFYPTVVKDRCLLVDVITGTLYDAMTGRCLSSSQMRLVVATANPLAAAKPKRVRKATEAREAQGWTNEKRRAA
jgi:hypothetical protein